MKNLQEKLAKVQVEKLEERKEFTFYFCFKSFCTPSHTCTPQCNPDNGGIGDGGSN